MPLKYLTKMLLRIIPVLDVVRNTRKGIKTIFKGNNKTIKFIIKDDHDQFSICLEK